MALSKDFVLNFYKDFPFERHPLWIAIMDGQLSFEQILRAETQHYLRSRAGAQFRLRAATEAEAISPKAHQLLMATYKEECTSDESGPSHLDLIKNFLILGGLTEDQLSAAKLTPGNAAAIALYKDIADRGPLHHMIGAGAVEYYYSLVSPKIFEAYTTKYQITEEQAHT